MLLIEVMIQVNAVIAARFTMIIITSIPAIPMPFMIHVHTTAAATVIIMVIIIVVDIEVSLVLVITSAILYVNHHRHHK